MPIPAIADAVGGLPAPAAGDSAASPCRRLHALAEHRWPLDGGDVIALTLDGIGMGENNGALWVGECLRLTSRW